MTNPTNTADVRAAAQAVVDRWDTPTWKDVPATAEYINRLRAALAAPAQAVPAPGVPSDADLAQAIDERDTAEGWADGLANAIGKFFGVDVGEHSNAHCPWREALEVIEEAAPPTEAGVTAAPRNATLYDPDDVAFPVQRCADGTDAPTELASIAAAEVAAPTAARLRLEGTQ